MSTAPPDVQLIGALEINSENKIFNSFIHDDYPVDDVRVCPSIFEIAA